MARQINQLMDKSFKDESDDIEILTDHPSAGQTCNNNNATETIKVISRHAIFISILYLLLLAFYPIPADQTSCINTTLIKLPKKASKQAAHSQ